MKADPAIKTMIANDLSSVPEEMREKLVRSAYSPIIREAHDAAAVLLDREGRILAQAQFHPLFMNGAEFVFREFAIRFDMRALAPGEALVTNDPYSGGQHLNDIALLTPVHADGQVVAFTVSFGHHLDIGGGQAGPNAKATELYQEGLIIPPMKVEIDRDLRPGGILYEMIGGNVRASRQVLGDVNAQIAANRAGAQRYVELVQRYGIGTLEETGRWLLDQSEQAMRRQIATLKPGEYRAEAFVDDDGFTDEPIKVALCVRVEGSDLFVDLEGSSPQVRGMVNSPLASSASAVYAAAYSVFGAGLLTPNSGYCRAIHVIVPKGTFLNPHRPAPVRARASACNRIYNAFMQAMAPLVPDRVRADGHDSTNAVGLALRTDQGYKVSMEVVGGGFGGSAASDGCDVVDCPISNCSNVPVEALEVDYPFVRVLEYALRSGSGGNGRWRGGLGAVRRYEILEDGVTLSTYSDRFRLPPRGLLGGGPGAASQAYILRGGERITLPSKANAVLCRGDIVVMATAGGGGFGAPSDRDQALAATDECEGRI